MGGILSLVLAVSLLVRGWGIAWVPPELFGDELDVGYQAYSLLHTGRDLYGQITPVYLHSLSEWRLPLIVYQTVPAVRLFGLSELGVRLPEVVMGILAPLILFGLVYRTLGDRRLAGVSALVLAILPWHVIYSRMAAFGVVSLLNFLMLGVLLFQRRRYLLAGVFFALCLYTYSTSVIFVPLLLALLFLARPGRSAITTLVVLAVSAAPLVIFGVSGQGTLRFSQISVFASPEVLENVTSFRKDHPGLLGRVLSNRPIEYAKLVSTNYLSAFSPEFLFIRGDPSHRHSIQITGGLYSVLAPFVVWGFLVLWRRDNRFWLWWLALAPLPSALTQGGGYHATRLFLMVAPLAVLGSTGVLAAWKRVSAWPVRLGALGLFAFVLFTTGLYYWVDYPKSSWVWWQYGFKDSLTQAARHSSDYSRVFINNTYEPALIRFLFWSAYPPAKFHSAFRLDQEIPEIMPNYNGFSLGNKFFFGQFSVSAQKEGISRFFLPGALYLISQRDDVGGNWDWRTSPPAGGRVFHTTLTPPSAPLFYLVTRQ